MPPSQPTTLPKRVQNFKSSLASGTRVVTHHLKRHVGVGIICSVAYFDPGNWSVDLEAGSNFGYRPMLFVILMAGLGAIVLQTLACKLGCVTGLDLASHCRLLLHNHPRHPKLVRRLALYPLYVLAEVAIISTDLAELLGSAIGFCLLFPQLPLWAGVVLTAADVLVFLALSDASRSQGRPVRMFEYTITGLVFAVFACFIALLVKAKPSWPDVFMGYIPNKALFQSDPDAVYAAVGILGATVMPHALFLGSSLSTQDRVSDPEPESDLPAPTTGATYSKPVQFLRKLFKIERAERVAHSTIDYRSKYGERENNSLRFIRQHLGHAIADVVVSLVAIAVPINSAILILAASVFYKGPDAPHQPPAGLFDAYDLIKANLGHAAATVFAVALLFAGQTSSITVTLAGQIVSEGFIEWKISPFLRRLLTRCISLVPSVVVAVAVGRSGITQLLVISQVILSIVLPFVAFPLIYLTSNELVMRVRQEPLDADTGSDETPRSHLESPGSLSEKDSIASGVNAGTGSLPKHTRENSEGLPGSSVVVVEEEPDSEIKKPKVAETKDAITSVLVCEESGAPLKPTWVDFSNGRTLCAAAYAMWGVVLMANAYAVVMLFIGA